MKKKHIVGLCASFLFLGVACSHNTTEIRTVAQGYLDAMGNYRPTDARAYASKETCEITLTFYESMLQHTDSAVYKGNIPATITLGEVKVTEDTIATVDFHKSTPASEQDGTLHLLRRDGHWQVHEVIAVPKILQPNLSPRPLPEEGFKK